MPIGQEVAIVKSTTYKIIDGDGNVVGALDGGQLGAIARAAGAGGGDASQTLQTVADAAMTAASYIEAGDVQEAVDDARDAGSRLYDARKELYDYLNEAGSTINGPKLMGLVRSVDVEQDKLDRAQNRALSISVSALWMQVFGNGLRMVGDLVRGSFRQFVGGGSDMIDALLMGGIGGVLAGMLFSDDDGEGRGRRRRRRRDEGSNVPPIPGV